MMHCNDIEKCLTNQSTKWMKKELHLLISNLMRHYNKVIKEMISKVRRVELKLILSFQEREK